ncbi:MAG: hypothetical protein METHP_02157 [Methanoregula sp. SKADARSKE-2]|nr:MAG: hypothetical protein METHP_02157 [Methanoregula sp. SKADARSKE-2]
MWIATVTLETVNGKYPEKNSRKNTATNKDRMIALIRITTILNSDSSEDGLIIFPGGWFHQGRQSAESAFSFIEKKIKSELQKFSSHIVISLGIDGSIDNEGFDRDQIAIVIDKTGIIAIGRKYQVLTAEERKKVILSPGYLQGDFGKPQIFSLNEIRFYPAICYDIYGPQQRKLENPGIDVIISHVHYFVPLNEEGPKGIVDFVRKGFVGCSAQWHCPVFGSGIFIRRSIPKCWHTGMNYRSHPKPYLKCKIEENILMPEMKFEDGQLIEGKLLVQKYNLGNTFSLINI